MMNGSMEVITRSEAWNVPLVGVSAQRTFWMRYGYISRSLAALGHDILWILMPSVLVTNPNTSSPKTGLQHLDIL